GVAAILDPSVLELRAVSNHRRLRLAQLSPRLRQVRLGLLESGLERPSVDREQEVALLDVLALAEVHGHQLPADLGLHLDRRDRLDGADRPDLGGHRFLDGSADDNRHRGWPGRARGFLPPGRIRAAGPETGEDQCCDDQRGVPSKTHHRPHSLCKTRDTSRFFASTIPMALEGVNEDSYTLTLFQFDDKSGGHHGVGRRLRTEYPGGCATGGPRTAGHDASAAGGESLRTPVPVSLVPLSRNRRVAVRRRRPRGPDPPVDVEDDRRPRGAAPGRSRYLHPRPPPSHTGSVAARSSHAPNCPRPYAGSRGGAAGRLVRQRAGHGDPGHAGAPAGLRAREPERRRAQAPAPPRGTLPPRATATSPAGVTPSTASWR